mmetsp:Transcript_11755/g.27414  ORF Transcript_11755/g.27414 Transcript_11755/m.27414 type:complete len:255 (-) Transcript_11755:716-1480(-)
MARQGIADRGGHGLAVADLADQDAVGCLAQRVLQRDLQRGGVAPDLALVDDRALVAEQVFDRVFDGEDVARHRLVAQLQHGSQRGALAGAGGAHHQNQAALFLDHLPQDGRQAEGLQGRDVMRDVAEYASDRAPLPKPGQPKAADAVDRHGHVQLAAVVELGERHRVDDLGDQLAWLRRRQQLVGKLHGLPVDADQHRHIGRQIAVRCTLVGHQPQDAFHVAAGHDQARSSSLMLVLERVCASTRLTMMAAYSE